MFLGVSEVVFFTALTPLTTELMTRLELESGPRARDARRSVTPKRAPALGPGHTCMQGRDGHERRDFHGWTHDHFRRFSVLNVHLVIYLLEVCEQTA